MRGAPLAHDAAAAERVSRFEQDAGRRRAGTRACPPADGPAHEVADPHPGRGGPGGRQRESPRQVARHVVVAERGQQHRAGPFRARAEFLEHLADERRFTGGIQVHRARIHRRGHGGPADLHERSRGRDQHVAGIEQLPAAAQALLSPRRPSPAPALRFPARAGRQPRLAGPGHGPQGQGERRSRPSPAR